MHEGEGKTKEREGFYIGKEKLVREESGDQANKRREKNRPERWMEDVQK